MHRLGVTEPAVGDVAEKEDKLLDQRPIVAELRAQLVARGDAHARVESEREGVAGSETDEKEADRRHEQDDDHRLAEAGSEIPPHSAARHGVAPPRPTRSRAMRSLGGIVQSARWIDQPSARRGAGRIRRWTAAMSGTS